MTFIDASYISGAFLDDKSRQEGEELVDTLNDLILSGQIVARVREDGEYEFFPAE